MFSEKIPAAMARTKRKTTFCVLMDEPPSVSLPRLADGQSKRRHDLEDVAHDAVIGDLEDGRFLVLVDRDDRLGRTHSGEMLNRSGDAHGDVQLRAHLTSRLADLVG